MKCIVTFCALCALWGCHQVAEPSGELIALSYSTSEQSKTDVLTSGDQIGVFASIEGTENCFLDNAKYVVGSDGRSLSTSPAVYYPEAKQAVRFFACFPYHTGVFSVPTDQSTALALKQADLCWASACSTPAKSAVPLEFTHQMARLLMTTNTPTEKIVIPNAFSGGTLNIRTGVFTNTLKSDISTTGTELILPVQTIARLILTIAGIEYVFEGAIPLETATTTTANLTLNPSSKTATLSGGSTVNWSSGANTGTSNQSATNLLTAAWVPAHSRTAEIDKIVLTINHNNTIADYTIAKGITQTNGIFNFAFADNTLSYPYKIEKIHLYKATELIQTTDRIMGATIYKSGDYTFGVNGTPLDITIAGLRWATGALVGSNNTPASSGLGGCLIGAPNERGLLFSFGSLIGYATTSGSNGGRTLGALPFVQWLRPIGCTAGPEFITGQITSNIPSVDDLIRGIGDPCRYYLGNPWRIATPAEAAALLKDSDYNELSWRSWGSAQNARWTSNGPLDGKTSGAWVGPNAKSGTPTLSTDLFFAALSNITNFTTLPSITEQCYPWLSEWHERNMPRCIRFNRNQGWVPADVSSGAAPVRCVRPI